MDRAVTQIRAGVLDANKNSQANRSIGRAERASERSRPIPEKEREREINEVDDKQIGDSLNSKSAQEMLE